MTLTICIKAKDGMVLASDSRASSYFTSNDTVTKLFRLDDHTGVGIAGDGPLAMYLLESISDVLDFTRGITSLAGQLCSESKKLFDEYFAQHSQRERPDLQIILAGYNKNVEPAIYTLNSNDNFFPRRNPTGFECIGIPVIADYILNRVYYPDVSVEHAAEMAAYCILETESQDHRVGRPVQLASFSNEQPYTAFEEARIARIYERCKRFSESQKGNFTDQEDASSGTSNPKDATKVG